MKRRAFLSTTAALCAGGPLLPMALEKAPGGVPVSPTATRDVYHVVASREGWSVHSLETRYAEEVFSFIDEHADKHTIHLYYNGVEQFPGATWTSRTKNKSCQTPG